MEITELTPAERRVRDAYPRGTVTDFGTGNAAEDDPETGAGWGPERTVRAGVLRDLLLSGAREDGEIPALRVVGARITGVLDIRYAVAECAVLLAGCHFEGPPNFYGAEVRQLNLSESVLPGLHAATLQVRGALRLTDCRITGQVRLGGSRVEQAVFLDRTRIGVHADGSTAPTDGPVLQMNHITAGDDLWMPELVVHGETRIAGAVVTGQIVLDDARLVNPGGTVLHAETLSVGTDLHAMRLWARGLVNLRGARVPGQLNLAYGSLAHPGGTALRASSAVIGELWLRGAARVRGRMNLRRARIDLIHAEPDVWSEEVQLDGLTFTTLLPHLPAVRRLPMLESDQDGYVPYAYEQLTASYRRVGDDGAARTVQLAKQRRYRETLPAYGRAWGRLQDAGVGYGFRPARAAAWLLSLLLVGSVAFGVHHPAALKPDEAPDFNPLFYTADLLLPIVDFGQERAFDPQGWYQWLSYALIVTGWLLATTIAAGITRSVSRS